MTRDDIIRMAREAGIPSDELYHPNLELFAAFVAAHKTEVAIAEAYRCGYEAGVVEEREAIIKATIDQGFVGQAYADEFATTIRNRGKE